MPSRSRSGWVLYAILAAVAIPLLFAAYYFVTKSDASKKALSQTHKQMEVLYALDPGIAKQKDYVQKLINTSHPKAFDNVYKMGAKYDGESSDMKDYYSELFKLMAQKAKDDGNKEITEMMAGAALMMEFSKMVSPKR